MGNETIYIKLNKYFVLINLHYVSSATFYLPSLPWVGTSTLKDYEYTLIMSEFVLSITFLLIEERVSMKQAER